MANFQDVPEKDLSGGIDAQSSPNQILPTFAKDLVNCDIKGTNPVKRAGYVGHGGALPHRVDQITYVNSTNKIRLTFDSVVDLSASGSTPLVVYGHLGTDPAGMGGDFSLGPTDTVRYYPSFTAEFRDTLTAPTGTITKALSDRPLTDEVFFTGVSKSTSTSNLSHEIVVPDEIWHNQSSEDLLVDYAVSPSTDAFIYYLGADSEPGVCYVTDALSVTGGPTFYSSSITAATHGLGNYNIAAQFFVNDGGYWKRIWPNTVTITLATGTVSVQYAGNPGATVRCVLRALPLDNTATLTVAGVAPLSFNSTTDIDLLNNTITETDHGLVTGDLLTFSGTLPTGLSPATTYWAIVVDANTFKVGATSTDTIGVNITAAAVGTGVVTVSSRTSTLVIPAASVENPWIFPVVYQDNTTTYEEVMPESYVYDASTGEVTLTVRNTSTSGITCWIYYEYGEIAANSLLLTPVVAVTGDFVDTSAHLTVWGLGHEDSIYGGSKDAREGWVTHLDGYRQEAGNHLVAAVGGAPYFEGDRATYGTAYDIPLAYPNARARTGTTDIIVGPTFHLTGEVPARTLGYLTSDTVATTNQYTITSVTYNSGTGYVDYLLSTPNLVVRDSTGADIGLGSITTVIPTSIAELTVTNVGHSRTTGTFTIKALAATTSTLTVSVQNSLVTSSDYDETGLAGWAGIYTDTLPLSASTEAIFIPGDTLISTALSSTSTLEVIWASVTTLYIRGATATQTVESGVQVAARRTSRIIPLRASATTASVTNFLKYDMVSITGESTEYEISEVNTQSNISLSSGVDDGTYLTITFSGATTSTFSAGQRIFITRTLFYSGEHVIIDIPSSTTMRVASTGTAGSYGTGRIIGKTITLDKAITYYDSVTNGVEVEVTKRWLPIEAPLNSAAPTILPPLRYWPSSTVNDQSFVRSTMMSDNLYYTEGVDPVLKYDGSNIYRSGLFRWQPRVFLTTTNTGGVISVSSVSKTVSSRTGNVLEVAAGDELVYRVGQRIRHTDTSPASADYTITSIEKSPGGSITGKIHVDNPVSGTGTGTIATFQTWSYYLRLNTVDPNNNVVASAVVGEQDLRISLASNQAIVLNMSALPTTWDTFDSSRLELEIYRSSANSFTEYRKIVTLPYSTGAITFTDTLSDDDWVYQPLDPVNSALLGAELGTGWREPQRAKYITSIDNKLVLANILAYPKLDFQLIGDTGSITAASLHQKKWTIKRRNSLAVSTTDITNQATFEWLNSGEMKLINRTTTFEFDSTSDLDDATETVTEVAHGLLTGDRVRVSVSAGALPTGLSAATDYWIIKVTADTFKFASTITLAFAGTAIDLTDAVGTTLVTPMRNVISSTVYSISHGLVTGNRIYAFQSAAGVNLLAGGWSTVTRIDDHTFTASAITGGDATCVDRYITATTKTDIPVWIGTDGNLGTVNGNSGIPVFDAVRRLTAAINEHLSTWVLAEAGGEYAAGQWILRQPKVDTALVTGEALEVTLPASYSGYTIFANGIKQAAGAEVQTVERLFPSRLLLSYTNYPEIFDNPEADLPEQSDSVIDVNPSDGQGITAVIPFFGDSAFGAASKGAILVVFKENSIYLVNADQKSQGGSPGVANPVQKLESRGMGCTAPYSVAYTNQGIIFANEAGIFRLTTQLAIEPVGLMLDKKWRGVANLDRLDLCHGHHYASGNQYKLSLPVDEDIENSQVYVYDHSLEERKRTTGPWTRYTNHPATGWANLNQDAFFGATQGKVFRVRTEASTSKFRDGAAGIATTIELAPKDFGAAGIRKVVSAVTLHLASTEATSGTTIAYAFDLDEDFTATTSVLNITDTTRLVTPIRVSLSRARSVYFQLKVTNSTVDEPLELCGLDYSVAGLTDKGVREPSEL